MHLGRPKALQQNCERLTPARNANDLCVVARYASISMAVCVCICMYACMYLCICSNALLLTEGWPAATPAAKMHNHANMYT